MGILGAVVFFLPPSPPWRAGRGVRARARPIFLLLSVAGRDAPHPKVPKVPETVVRPRRDSKGALPRATSTEASLVSVRECGKPALPFAVGHGRDRDPRGTRRTGSGLTRGEGEGSRGTRTGTERNRGPGLCLCLFRPAVRFPHPNHVYYSRLPVRPSTARPRRSLPAGKHSFGPEPERGRRRTGRRTGTLTGSGTGESTENLAELP